MAYYSVHYMVHILEGVFRLGPASFSFSLLAGRHQSADIALAVQVPFSGDEVQKWPAGFWGTHHCRCHCIQLLWSHRRGSPWDFSSYPAFVFMLVTLCYKLLIWNTKALMTWLWLLLEHIGKDTYFLQQLLWTPWKTLWFPWSLKVTYLLVSAASTPPFLSSLQVSCGLSW